MDKGNWARLMKRSLEGPAAAASAKAKPAAGGEKDGTKEDLRTHFAGPLAEYKPPSEDDKDDSTLVDEVEIMSTKVVERKKVFQIPVPGKGKAVAGALKGKTVVLTGLFPEVCM